MMDTRKKTFAVVAIMAIAMAAVSGCGAGDTVEAEQQMDSVAVSEEDAEESEQAEAEEQISAEQEEESPAENVEESAPEPETEKTDPAQSAEESASKEEMGDEKWRQAYIDYIQETKDEEEMGLQYQLFYMDEDEIPELLANSPMGSAYIVTADNDSGEYYVTELECEGVGHSILYVERQNFVDCQGSFHNLGFAGTIDSIYRIEDKKACMKQRLDEIFENHYTDGDYSKPEGSTVTYHRTEINLEGGAEGDGEEISEEEYNSGIRADEATFVGREAQTAEEMLKTLEAY